MGRIFVTSLNAKFLLTQRENPSKTYRREREDVGLEKEGVKGKWRKRE